MSNESFSQRLSVDQVQKILDDLSEDFGLNWRDHQPNSLDFVTVDHPWFNSGLGINVRTGQWNDYYLNGESTGDIVELCAMFWNEKGLKDALTDSDIQVAIAGIQAILGNAINPNLGPDQEFAKNVIAEKKEPYVMVPKSIWANQGLSRSAKLVWIAIFDRCGRGKSYAFPGINKIAKDIGIGRSAVDRALDELKENGLLIEMSRGKGRAPNRFPIVRVHNP